MYFSRDGMEITVSSSVCLSWYWVYVVRLLKLLTQSFHVTVVEMKGTIDNNTTNWTNTRMAEIIWGHLYRIYVMQNIYSLCCNGWISLDVIVLWDTSGYSNTLFLL